MGKESGDILVLKQFKLLGQLSTTCFENHCLPDIRFKRTIRTGDRRPAGQAGHAVPSHRQGVLAVGGHAREGGGDPRIRCQATVPRLVVPSIPRGGITVAERPIARVEGQRGEDRS